MTLANKITAWFAASAFLLILFATTALYWSLARTLDREDRLFLSDKIHTVSALLAANPANVKERVEKEWTTRKFERVYVKVTRPGSAAPLTETPDFEEIAKKLFTEPGPPQFGATRRVDGRTFKVAQSGDIQIALDRTQEDSILAAYRSRLAAVLLLTLVLAVLIGRRVAMLDRLNEALERLSRFSQDIAHDLRTPINNLRGVLEVAAANPRTVAEYQDVLGSCLEECDRLSHLIDSLLFLARAENPGAKLSIEKVDVEKEIERLREFFEASAMEAGLKLEVQTGGSLTINADRALLQRALGNLIHNAIHHAGRGTLTIAAHSTHAGTQICVRDTGKGIPKEHLSKIFDRFYRVDESRSVASGGTGLGLCIVQSIMTLHHGKVEATSELGRGTEIRLSFPPFHENVERG